jgi:hypothetical protein
LKPKEEIILVIAPNDFHNYAAESYLRDDHAIPHPIE